MAAATWGEKKPKPGTDTIGSLSGTDIINSCISGTVDPLSDIIDPSGIYRIYDIYGSSTLDAKIWFRKGPFSDSSVFPLFFSWVVFNARSLVLKQILFESTQLLSTVLIDNLFSMSSLSTMALSGIILQQIIHLEKTIACAFPSGERASERNSSVMQETTKLEIVRGYQFTSICDIPKCMATSIYQMRGDNPTFGISDMHTSQASASILIMHFFQKKWHFGFF